MFALSALVGCGGLVRDDRVVVDDDPEQGSAKGLIAEGSAEALGVLAFLNSAGATLETLTSQAGVTRRAATNIVAHVRGPDSRLGTRDDDPFDTISELDAVAYVGPVTLEKLRAHVAGLGSVPSVVIEGVALTEAQARAVLLFANQGTMEQIDGAARLDTRAAQAIIEARPIGSLEQLAALPYVARGAIENLRDFASSWTPPAAGCTPRVTRRSSDDVLEYNQILSDETMRDYPYASLTAMAVPACVNFTSQALAEAIQRSAGVPWAIPELLPQTTGLQPGARNFLLLLQESRQAIDDRGDPSAHPDLDQLFSRISAPVEEGSGAYVEQILWTDNEECSETAVAAINTLTGHVLIVHRFPRC